MTADLSSACVCQTTDPRDNIEEGVWIEIVKSMGNLGRAERRHRERKRSFSSEPAVLTSKLTCLHQNTHVCWPRYSDLIAVKQLPLDDGDQVVFCLASIKSFRLQIEDDPSTLTTGEGIKGLFLLFRDSVPRQPSILVI